MCVCVTKKNISNTSFLVTIMCVCVCVRLYSSASFFPYPFFRHTWPHRRRATLRYSKRFSYIIEKYASTAINNVTCANDNTTLAHSVSMTAVWKINFYIILHLHTSPLLLRFFFLSDTTHYTTEQLNCRATLVEKFHETYTMRAKMINKRL